MSAYVNGYENGYVPVERYWADDVADEFEREQIDWYDGADEYDVEHYLLEEDMMEDVMEWYIDRYYSLTDLYLDLEKYKRYRIIRQYQKDHDIAFSYNEWRRNRR